MANAKIKTKNPGILEVPEDKKFWQLPLSHYEKLVDKKGYTKIIRALTNLEVWNKNDDPKISKKASDIADKLKKKYKKEALTRQEINKYSIDEYSELVPFEFKLKNTTFNGYMIDDLYIFTVEDWHKMCNIVADIIASKLGDTFEKLFDKETAAELMKDDPASFEAGLTLIENLDENEDFLYKFNEIEDTFIANDGEEYLILKED